MVFTGYPYDNGRKTEIIDVENSTFACTKLKSFPARLQKATAGFINGQTPFLCGGYDATNNRNSKDCYKLTDAGSWAKDQIASLNTPRHNAGFGSVVMNGNQLVLSGGYNGGGYLKTIELVTPNARAKTLNVQLPIGFHVHCNVPWDSETFLITGGYNRQRGGGRTKTYFVNVKTATLTDGPSLKLARRDHACAELNVLRKSYVIVSGGKGGSNGGASRTTEVLDKGNVGQGWQQGKPI